MLEILGDLPDHVLGIRASGSVSAEDYERVLVPALETKLTRHPRVRLLYHLSEDFDGYTGGAAWEDAKVGMRHFTAFERIAVVTDVDWVKTGVKAFGFIMPGEVRVYPSEGFDDALGWIGEPLSTGALEFELLREDGILILAPRGPLEAADFERMTAAVDEYLAGGGALSGLLIDAEHFPGWEDLAALTSHFRFVKNNQKRIRRVAFATDDRLLNVVPRIAGRFLSAEVRAFPAEELDEAVAWIREAAE